jgi:RHS repeat-associated protein
MVRVLPRFGARLCSLVLFLAAGSFLAPGQSNSNTDQGLKPYESFQGGMLDSVTMTGGNLFFHETEYAVGQRGRVGLTFSLQYNNKGLRLQIICPGGTGTGCTTSYKWIWVGSGVRLISDQGLFVSGTVPFAAACSKVDSGSNQGNGTGEIFVYVCNATTPDGSTHPLADTGSGYRSIDASGILWQGVPASSVLTPLDRNGMFVGGSQDTNGNLLSTNSSGNYIDTLGRVIPPQPDYASVQTLPASSASLSSCPNLNLPYQPVVAAYAWNPPGPTGTSPFILCYASVYIRTALFGNQSLNTQKFHDVSRSVNMLQSLVRPDGTAWTFTYDGANPSDSTSIGYGDLLKIGFPLGGSLAYTWGTEFPYQGQYTSDIQTTSSRSVETRTVDANDGTGPHTWKYTWASKIVANTLSNYVVENTVTSPLGDDTVHQITGFYGGPSLFETQTRSYQGSQSSGTLLKTVNTDYTYSSNPFDELGFNTNPPTAINVAPIRVTTILPNGLTTKEETDRDSAFTFRDPLWGTTPNGVLNSATYPGTLGTIPARREFDYGSGSAGNLLRQTFTTYLWQGNSAYLSANLLDLPATVIVKDGGGCALAETDYTDDESAYLTTSNISTQHGNPPNSVRGNPTTVTRWLAATSSCNPKGGTAIVTHTNWYDTGEAYQQIDARGNTITHSYDTAYAGAYPTKTCNALNQCVSGAYDFNSGVTTSFTDANGQTSNFAYDSRWRLTQALATTDPVSGVRPETDFDYSVATQVKRRKLQTPGTSIVDYAYFDGLGRTKQTRLVDPEGDDLVEMTYDGLGRVATVSNPHRSASSPTDGTTTNAYDALGRVTKVTKQDGSVVTTQYDQTSANSPNGVCTTTTDEAGKQRKSCVDGLARLIEVDEPQASTGSLSNPYITLYSYDPLGNLLQVNQKGDGTPAARVRAFTYDSLSRLLTANNPESGTISYQYDANGNLLQKTSPAPNQTGTATQTISYCYDMLNRETGRAYSAQSCASGQLPSGTAVDSYTYDQGSNGIGHLTSWSDQAGTGSYTFDPLGRMTGETRTLNGVQKSMSYSYNLDSSLKTLTYPSGAVITYTPDTSGRILSAVDKGNAINYATGATYSPPGSMTGFVSGNSASFAGITNSFSYNQRLQPINMSASSPSATVFSLNYDFHLSAGDNGNVFGITNNKDTSRNQTFAYDALNRLTSAQNVGTDCTQKTLNANQTKFWSNNYSYDAWGNLLTKSPTKCSAENLNESADVQNRMHVISGPDYSYDAAGNMTHDATSGLNYSYDQENRIAGAGGFAYTYDAEGNRVEKSNGSTGTLYWYMAPGIVAESDLSGNLQSEYVFFDGERVARKDFPNNTVSYYFSDRLNTTNVVTDAQGNIKNESDFYPWGGEIQFLANDANKYRYGGHELDGETGLYYYGARYYSNSLGRFITPDWSALPVPVPYADLHDPQTLNLYGYVRNLPTTNADSNGHTFEGLKQDLQRAAANVANAFKTSGQTIARAYQTTAKTLGQAYTETGKQLSLNPNFSFSHMTVKDAGNITTSIVMMVVTEGGSTGANAGRAAGTVSTESTLTRLATQAVDNIGPGSGPAYGTAVHSEFADLVDGLGNSNLSTEVSYKGGQVVDYGTPGSIRADVVEGPVDAPTAIYDLKTGNATLTPTRTTQIQNELPGGSNVPVKEIKPQNQ